MHRIFIILLGVIFNLVAISTLESCFNTECYPAPLTYPKDGCHNHIGFVMQNMWPCSSPQSGWTYYCCKLEAAAPLKVGQESSGGESGVEHQGKATWYEILGILACGSQHSDSEFIAAIGINYWNKAIGNPNKDPICGRQAIVTNVRNGKTVTVTIRDKCYSCGEGNLDLSAAAFETLGESRSVGLFKIKWSLI